MLTCFSSKMRITQYFGNQLYFLNGKIVKNGTEGSYEYYHRYGLNGHNGLDVVPEERCDIKMYNFFSGKIIKLEDHKAYGNRLVIWNKSNMLMEYHCHMLRVNPELNVGDLIPPGFYIGEMGSTGFSTGAHDHIAFRKTDKKGYIVDLDNGYNGYLDPLNYIS